MWDMQLWFILCFNERASSLSMNLLTDLYNMYHHMSPYLFYCIYLITDYS